jgi:hypothetical protein
MAGGVVAGSVGATGGGVPPPDAAAGPARRRGNRCRGLLETTQARIDVDIHVALALRRHLALVAQHLDLSAQLLHFLAQNFQLLGKLEGGIGGREPLERLFHPGEALRQRLDTLALLGNVLTRDVVAAEKLRLPGRRSQKRRASEG